MVQVGKVVGVGGRSLAEFRIFIDYYAAVDHAPISSTSLRTKVHDSCSYAPRGNKVDGFRRVFVYPFDSFVVTYRITNCVCQRIEQPPFLQGLAQPIREFTDPLKASVRIAKRHSMTCAIPQVDRPKHLPITTRAFWVESTQKHNP